MAVGSNPTGLIRTCSLTVERAAHNGLVGGSIPSGSTNLIEGDMVFHIQWRANEGLGDFISGLCYAHSSVIKYQRPVRITFHWPNAENFLYSKDDTESIYDRFQHVLSYMRPVDNLTIDHIFESRPKFRFINNLEEFNPMHGLWYPKELVTVEKGLVVLWTSRYNTKFVGYEKDPAHNVWDKVTNRLVSCGYHVAEVTYRTPISEMMDLIRRCEFGIGYQGMAMQLYKFMWKPLVVISGRVKWCKLLTPQAHIIDDPNLFLGDIQEYVKESKKAISDSLNKHQIYLADIQDPMKHPLYGKEKY